MKRVLVYSAQMEAVGGIESHVVQLCLQFARAGHAVTLMSSRFVAQRDTEAQLAGAGVQFVVNRRRWSSGSPLAKWLWTTTMLARLLARRFDVVYTNGQGRNTATVHAWYRLRARLVHHHHTACDAGNVATWPASYVTAMAKADALIVCAEFIRLRMCDAIGRKDVTVVYCFSKDRTPGAEAKRPESGPVSFGYFGRLIREKGIEWIMRLSREPRLEGIRWIIWGPESTYRARDFEGFTNLEYGGAFSPGSDLRSALQQLQCYCLFSSHPEGIPVSLLEVIAAGRPWIATPQGGIPELVHDTDSCVLVALDDYEGIVSACLAMARRIRSGGVDAIGQRAFYMSRFSCEVLLMQWQRVVCG